MGFLDDQLIYDSLVVCPIDQANKVPYKKLMCDFLMNET